MPNSSSTKQLQAEPSQQLQRRPVSSVFIIFYNFKIFKSQKRRPTTKNLHAILKSILNFFEQYYYLNKKNIQEKRIFNLSFQACHFDLFQYICYLKIVKLKFRRNFKTKKKRREKRHRATGGEGRSLMMCDCWASTKGNANKSIHAHKL